MWGWLREFQEIRHENQLRKARLREAAIEKQQLCNSCEVLKVELSNERREKEVLLNHLLSSRQEPERLAAPEPQIQTSRQHVPWKVRQQMLEQEDRVKAQVLASFQKRDAEIRNTAELEQTLGITGEK